MDKRARLLIVDDDPMIVESLISILEAEGYDARAAGTGEEALRELERGFFNIVLVDIKLPDMTGLDLLARVKETTPRMRKLVLTGFPDVPSAVEAVNRKADAYLVKPFDPDSLLRLIEKNLEEQREELRLTQERVLDFIKNRVKQLDESRNIVH
ncbi:MAG: response regulator [Candidatus Bathyarchaeota archaeon]